MTAQFWELNEAKSSEYFAEFLDAQMGDPGSRWWSAGVKADGCVNLYRYHNEPMGQTKPDNIDYMHLCDLDETIARLTALRDAAKDYFASQNMEWPL